jgi:conjugal transfer pilus assembly protein TraD
MSPRRYRHPPHLRLHDPALGVGRPDLGHVTTALWSVSLAVFLGVALGAGAFVYLRRRGLRWSWALAAVPFVYVLWLIDWRVGLGLAAASAAAIGLGVHDHDEATRHGGEEARRLADSVGPARFAASRVKRHRAVASRLGPNGLAIGTTPRGVCRVPFGSGHGVHALVAGATGAGKTVTQGAIAEAYVEAGFAALSVDPKGDGELRATLEEVAARRGVPFRAWTPDGAAIYNPLARGNPTEIADKALSGHRWSEPHYELATQRLLLQALPTMKAAGLWPPTLSTLVEHMDPERLGALGDRVGGETKERVDAYLGGLTERARSDLRGGRDRLSVLADSELGPRLDPALGSGQTIDLDRGLRGGEVLYLHLDADRYPAASKLLAAALLIDLIGLTADLQGEWPGALVAIDEFAALGADQVSRLFARARSARISMLLGTQSLADLRGARPDDPSDTLTEQVLSNISYAVIHRIGDPDSAERLARFAGTVPSWSTTQRVGPDNPLFGRAEGTRTREREFLVGPDEFKRLRTGQAVVINPAAKRRAEVVRVWPARGGQGRNR